MGLDLACSETMLAAPRVRRGVGPGRLRQDADAAPPAGLTLERLTGYWGAVYYLSDDGPPYAAHRRPEGPPITADTLEGLQSALKADYVRWLDLTGEYAR